MHRKEFIKKCCAACVGGSFMTVLLQSCAGSKIITAPIEGSELIVLVKEFELEKTDPVQFRKYLMIQNDRLEYPICLYRFSSNRYAALWMRCTHQGTELQVFGDKLHCPAHGSEFNNDGTVANGPASESLRSFVLSVAELKVKISLT